MRRTRLGIFLVSFLSICCAVGATRPYYSSMTHKAAEGKKDVGYGPDNLPERELKRWRSFSILEKAQELYWFRNPAHPQEFAVRFKLFFDDGPTREEIDDFLAEIGLPLGIEETRVLSELITETPDHVRNRNAVEYGFQLCAFTTGNRVELIFLDADERKIYAEAVKKRAELGDKRAESGGNLKNLAGFFKADLEGRLSRGGGENMIPLGGTPADALHERRIIRELRKRKERKMLPKHSPESGNR